MSESEDELPPEEENSEDENESDDFEDEDSSEDEQFVDDIDAWEGEGEPVQYSQVSDGKFDKVQIAEDVKAHHPEVKAYTYDDMYKTMTTNETIGFFTRFEVAAILGFRALQLNKGAEPFIETSLVDSYEIAKKELETGNLPFIIRRPLPNGTYVHVRAQDLQLLC